MKKAVLIVLIGILAMTGKMRADAATLPAAAHTDPDATEWTMGYTPKINAMLRGTQGSNGWYCLYTPETNKNGSFDLSRVDTAQWRQCSNCWKYYGVTYNWSPGLYLQDDYDFSGNSNWWLMDGNGRMDTNVARGVATGVYAWSAPEADDYYVRVDFVAGGGNQEYDGVRYYATDGVTISINTAKGLVKKYDAPATHAGQLELSQGRISGNVSLEKNELVYFFVDPQEAGDYDYAQLKIYIKVAEEGQEPEDEGLGDEDGDGAGNGEGDGIGNENGDESGEGDGNEEGSNMEDGSEEESGDGDGNGTGNGTGDGTGDGNGDGNGTGDAKDDTSSEDNQQEVPKGKPDVPLPEEDMPEEEEPEEKISVEKLKDIPLFALAKDAADRLARALNGDRQEISVEEAKKAEAAEAGGGSSGDDAAQNNILKIILVVVGVAEILGAGIVIGTGRFYKNK